MDIRYIYETTIRWYLGDGTKTRRIEVYGNYPDESLEKASGQIQRELMSQVVACEYAITKLDRLTGGSRHSEVIQAVCELSHDYYQGS